ncbi:MAG TPA: hypothetical protein GX406_00770 [Pseudoclavibacter sp.]|nr:hypothetical protein [Pseudoclavibacter sp.]
MSAPGSYAYRSRPAGESRQRGHQRAEVIAELRSRMQRLHPEAFPPAGLPTHPALAALLPGGGMRAGGIYTVSGSYTLALSALVEATQRGNWAAVCGSLGSSYVAAGAVSGAAAGGGTGGVTGAVAGGAPGARTRAEGTRAHTGGARFAGFGVEAAVELGANVERIVFVPRWGDQWLATLTAVIDAVSVVVCCGLPPVSGQDAARISARLRQREAALVVAGSQLPGADARVRVRSRRWSGLGQGWGRLAECEVDVESIHASGRVVERRLGCTSAGIEVRAEQSRVHEVRAEQSRVHDVSVA